MILPEGLDERGYTTLKRTEKTGEASKKDVTKMYSTAKGKGKVKTGTKRNIGGTSNRDFTGVAKKKLGVKSKRGY